jgi:hypothetical protein
MARGNRETGALACDLSEGRVKGHFKCYFLVPRMSQRLFNVSSFFLYSISFYFSLVLVFLFSHLVCFELVFLVLAMEMG